MLIEALKSKLKKRKNHMLALERHRKILEIAKRDGAVRTQSLASLLEVTEETVRRDLDGLSRQGLLHRTHGGATENSMVIRELSRSEREGRQAAEKGAIAKAAVMHIGENETLMLDASSTALELARHLPEKLGLRVVTYAIGVVEKLAVRNDIEVILLGGIHDPKAGRFHGMLTEMGVRALRIDRFFFSGGGFDPSHGIGEPNPEEARLKATIIAHARWKCAMLDHTKLGGKTDHYFVRPDQIDLLVTDAGGADYCKKGNLKGIPYEVR
jgi:DeoR/GlpR family transcriptional regulator of sugar metabolism